MSVPQYANVPAGFSCPPPVNFIAANGTAAKVVVDQLPAAIATSTTPQYYGGGTCIDLLATSSDGTARAVLVYVGTILTTQSGGSTGAMTTTSSTIVRASGSFITDGWLVGDLVMTFAPFGTAPNASMDGVIGTITTVAALTLTVNGTPFSALTLAAGTRIVKMSARNRVTVAITAGTDGTTRSQSLIGASTDGSLLTSEIKLGLNNILVAGMQASVSALPAVVSVQPTIALY